MKPDMALITPASRTVSPSALLGSKAGLALMDSVRIGATEAALERGVVRDIGAAAGIDVAMDDAGEASTRAITSLLETRRCAT